MYQFRWIIIAFLGCYGPVTLADVRDQQQQLDAACEAAREIKLAPERQAYIEECVSEWGRTREYCTHFYRDYGDTLYREDGEIQRYALYYDLPECEKAWRFFNRHRRPD